MFERKNPQNNPHRTNKLIQLVRTYTCKKHIKMKPIMNSILDRLMKDQPISKRQLEVIVPYLQNDLKNHTVEQIYDWFSVCIYNYPTVSDDEYLQKYYPHIIEDQIRLKTPNTLEPFLQY